MTTSPVSVQLYTVREALQDDLQGTLNKLAEVGFTQVEPFAFTNFPGLGDALSAAGLAAPTVHVHFLGETDEDRLDTVAERNDSLEERLPGDENLPRTKGAPGQG